MSESAHITQIGLPPWNDKELKAIAFEFSELYKSRPIQNNQGGMKAPHMFAVFSILKALRPEAVIESGVWRGAGTWLIEQAAPEAEIFALDPNLNRLQYRSSRASYSTIDFNLHDWAELPNSTVVLFDDHQDAFVRMQQSLWHGIRHVIFEDNYPATQGDCYSLKKLFSGAGFKPAEPSRGLLKRFSQAFQETNCAAKVLPGTEQQASVKKNIAVYSEFPPVLRTESTRWHDAWSDDKYPTLPAVFKSEEAPPRVFIDEAQHYTWLAYAELNVQ